LKSTRAIPSTKGSFDGATRRVSGLTFREDVVDMKEDMDTVSSLVAGDGGYVVATGTVACTDE